MLSIDDDDLSNEYSLSTVFSLVNTHFYMVSIQAMECFGLEKSFSTDRTNVRFYACAFEFGRYI